MEYLSPLDAAFLDAEDEDRHASLAIASVAIVEGPPPSQEEFVAAVMARLPMIPRYRQRVRTVLFDLGQPAWVDDPNFDLGYHVRRTALPAPGDEAALCRLVGRVMSQRLDRDRPLWECWVIEGLADGRWAVLSKVHHCMADGVSGNQIYSLIFDDVPKPVRPRKRPATAEAASDSAPEPNTVRLILQAVGSLIRSPAEQVRLLAQGVRAPLLVARQVRDTTRGLVELARALVPGTRSSLSGPIGQPRRYYVARASLPDVVGVGKALNVTVNDVLLAAISGAFRALLLHRGEQPVADAVRTLVPVSVRAKGDEGIIDNRISLMLPLLPVDIADPVDRLNAVHARLEALKASKEAQAGVAVTTLARHEPFAPISWAIRFAARLPQRTIVTVTTNVPGPRRPLYVLGRQMLEILPYVPIALRIRTGVSILTYCDQMAFGITSDYDSAPEVELLGRAIADGVTELVEAARAVGSDTPASGRARKRVRKNATVDRTGARRTPAPIATRDEGRPTGRATRKAESART
jgi:diacylglycerol O-acyltransferase